MKKATLFGCAFAICVVFSSSLAQAMTIALWTFETTPPTSAGPHSADFGTGTATSVHASATTEYTTPSGNGSEMSWNSNSWAVGDYYQFQVSTLGESEVMFTWDQTRSSAGPRGPSPFTNSNFRLQYSTDGLAFADVIDYLVPAASPNWNSTTVNLANRYSYDFSSNPALDNQANVYFRLTAILPPQNSGGQSRVDNIRVTAIPEPASLMLVLLGGALVATGRKRG